MTLQDYSMNTLMFYPPEGLTGRTKIKTNVTAITADNVVNVVTMALGVHAKNAGEIDYLYNYYKGRQDIRGKQKIVRDEINNKVTINIANQIVTFKTAYFLGEPLQYISHGGNDETSEKVNRLNEYMRAEDKASKDKEVVDWMHICGVAERLTLTDEMAGIINGAPFYIYTLDPRTAFVIYSSRIGERPLAGVILEVDENDEPLATVYTDLESFILKNGEIVDQKPHILGGVPLVEYVNNEARMGAFETVIPILNAINVLESNAVDSVQDFVNGFDVFQNCEINDGDYGKLSIGGQAIMVKSFDTSKEAKVYRVASEISQTGVQTRVDDLTDKYIEICGLPNRNGGSSTSDTGTAVIYRDGWSDADSRAKDTEVLFKRSERMFDRIVLNICKRKPYKDPLDLELADFEPDFPRGNLTNLQSKVQVLCEMLNTPKIHPKYAFSIPGLFDDAEEAYRTSMEYYEKNNADLADEMEQEFDNARSKAVSTSRQSAGDTEEEGTPAA